MRRFLLEGTVLMLASLSLLASHCIDHYWREPVTAFVPAALERPLAAGSGQDTWPAGDQLAK